MEPKLWCFYIGSLDMKKYIFIIIIIIVVVSDNNNKLSAEVEA